MGEVEMKACKGKAGPHQYDEELKQCPECKVLSRKRFQKKPKKPMPKCSVDWCEKGSQARGYCSAHLSRLNRGTDMNKPFPVKVKHCVVEDCDEPIIAKGYCRKHYTRVSKWGDPNVCKPKPTQNPDAMKVCRKGLHTYRTGIGYCPECKKIAADNWNKIPENKEKIEAAHKKFRASPKGKQLIEKDKEKQKSPERKAVAKAHRELPEVKEKRRARNQSPKAKASLKEWRDGPKGKAWREKYDQKPERKAARLVSDGKRTKIAAAGDLTNEQWIERLEEFDHKCAYCSIQLLTSVDNVPPYHPQYQNLEHIIPLLGRGQHTKANIVPACYSCNMSKNNKDVWVWMASRSIIPSEKLLPILLETTRLHQDTTNF